MRYYCYYNNNNSNTFHVRWEQSMLETMMNISDSPSKLDLFSSFSLPICFSWAPCLGLRTVMIPLKLVSLRCLQVYCCIRASNCKLDAHCCLSQRLLHYLCHSRPAHYQLNVCFLQQLEPIKSVYFIPRRRVGPSQLVREGK